MNLWQFDVLFSICPQVAAYNNLYLLSEYHDLQACVKFRSLFVLRKGEFEKVLCPATNKMAETVPGRGEGVM
jgi:hypothetical protein